MSQTSIANAKAQLTRLIHRVEEGEPVHITRRGKPVAVLLSEEDYRRLVEIGSTRSFWELVSEMRAASDFEPIDWSKEEVDSWRDQNPGRGFEWPE